MVFRTKDDNVIITDFGEYSRIVMKVNKDRSTKDPARSDIFVTAETYVVNTSHFFSLHKQSNKANDTDYRQSRRRSID
jgi:hypothetical protein